jgi:hypothetical protein
MDSDMTKSWLRTASLVLLVIGAAACGGDDTAGPSSDDPFDPEQSNAEFAAVENAIEANTDLEADLVHVSMTLSAMPAATWLLDPADLSAGSPLVRSVRTAPLTLIGSAQPIIPADLLGTTFEWDDAEGAYVATERTGAPAAGVRFILYDRTQAPPVENGFLDLTDESDPSADRLNVHLEKDDVTRLDFDVEVIETTSALTLSVGGFLTDGSSRVDFEVVEAVTETVDGFSMDISYSLSLAGEPLSVAVEYVIDFGTTVGVELTTTFVNGPNTLVLYLSQEGEGDLAGTVEWNGELVMTITDDGTGQPAFLGPEGEELTAAEAAAIQEMFEISFDGLGLLEAYLLFLGGGLD